MASSTQRQEIRLYLDRARQMVEVAATNLDGGFYESSVNRSYYAIFYAATALLLTKGMAPKRHSGVISAFRQHFVKPGLFEAGYSDIYGRLLNHRETSDYELFVAIQLEQAATDLQDARTFVAAVAAWLEEQGWL
jgi:uncharacterized protein